uniref:NorpA_8 protein n=1 Tax=Fopius arisanus TaxID=64838 RepID=A0A0C9RWR8_9HYME
MTKRFEFNWQMEVPEALRIGSVCDRWTEEKDNTEIELNCTFKVDEYGFFIYWQSEGKDGDVIELCQVSDVRAGGVPKVRNKFYHLVFIFDVLYLATRNLCNFFGQSSFT